ncbi:MAG: recombinase RecT [Patescibacteria group bacterium]|jgi:recombination protein RecT
MGKTKIANDQKIEPKKAEIAVAVPAVSKPTEQARVATTKAQGECIEDWLKRELPDKLAEVLPKHLTAERVVRVALMAILKQPLLKKCSKVSLFQCILTCTGLGLEPDGRRAHLIPYWNEKAQTYICTLIVDYKGIVELIYNTGDISFIHADIVRANDVFIHDKGELKSHQIDFKNPRGAVYAAYCLFRFKDGTEKVEVMTREEIEAIRRRSKSGDKGPWVTDWNEMAKKTACRRGSKWIKLSPEQREVLENDDELIIPGRFDNHPKLGFTPARELPAVDADGVVPESGPAQAFDNA